MEYNDAMMHISEIIDQSKTEWGKPISMGIDFLNENLGGFYPGELTMIMGGEDSGKTALIIREIHHVALDEHIPVLVVLDGFNEQTFLACMAAWYCSVFTEDVHLVLTHEWFRDEVEAYLDILRQAPIYFMRVADFASLNETELYAYITKNDIALLFLEHGNIVWTDSLIQDKLLRRVKVLAIELGISVVLEFNIFWEYHNLNLIDRKPLLAYTDNIVDIYDFTHNNVVEDIYGNRTTGKVQIKIIKHKGIATYEKEIYVPKMQLYVRSNSQATYLSKDNKPSLPDEKSFLGKLAKKFECEIEDFFWKKDISYS